MTDHLAHLQAGDRVTIRTPQGQERTGKVNRLLIFRTHVVLNMGGAHGVPAVADNRNIVRCSGCKRRTPVEPDLRAKYL